jgi:hypothetical protein
MPFRKHRQFLALALSLVLALLASAGNGREESQEKEGEAWYEKDRGPQVTDEGKPPSIGAKIALYPVNRIADLLDVATVNLGFGLGLHFNGHATRALQLGAGGSVMSKLGLDGRRAGMFHETRGELSALFFTMERYKRTRAFGPIPEADTSTARDRLYLDARRFTGVGAGVSAAIVGVEVEAKPSEAVDFLLGVFGVDLKRDGYPRRIFRPHYNRFYTGRRQGIDKIVFVTSRVVSSPDLRAEAREGITVYNNRARSSFFLGELGVLTGKDDDLQEAKDLQSDVEERGYDAVEAVALELARQFRDRASIEVVPPTALAEFRDKKVEKRLGAERIVRLPNYKGLCKEYGADAVCDVRLLEWSLYRDTLGQGLRSRLHVECKIIHALHPQSPLLADISVIAYDRSKQGNRLLDFAKDEGRLVQFETEQAVERVVAVLSDLLLER